MAAVGIARVRTASRTAGAGQPSRRISSHNPAYSPPVTDAMTTSGDHRPRDEVPPLGEATVGIAGDEPSLEICVRVADGELALQFRDVGHVGLQALV